MAYRASQEVQEIYQTNPVPIPAVTHPHPKQIRRRRAFRAIQDAYDPKAPDLLRVVIR